MVLKSEHAAERQEEALKRQMQAQHEEMERKIIKLQSLRHIEDDHRVLESYSKGRERDSPRETREGEGGRGREGGGGEAPTRATAH
jgi:hypothetical protein